MHNVIILLCTSSPSERERERESSLTRQAFTLIELLIVIALIAILSVVVILTLNPAQLIASSRDSNRVSDMATMTSAISLYLAEGGTGLGSSSIVYVSIPDPTATSTAGDQCQGLSLISLPSAYTYHCAASSTFRNVNGTGWIPINFSSLPAGSPLGNLPVDPTNNSSSRLYYTYDTNGSQYEVTSVMESSKYQLGGSNDVISSDGGTLASVYEKGSAFGLEPLDYGDSSLVGFWSFNEGTGTVAYDYSGNNATGSWNGTQVGTNGYYYAPGKIGSYAGDFDGSTDYVNVPANTSLQSTVGTWSAWIETSYGGAAQPAIMTQAASNSFSGVSIFFVGSTGKLNVWLYNSGTFVGGFSNGSVINNGVWHYIALTFNSATASLYVDGTQVASTTLSGSVNFSNPVFRIGKSTDASFSYFFGLIDDARVYNRVLTAAQISAMYVGGK